MLKKTFSLTVILFVLSTSAVVPSALEFSEVKEGKTAAEIVNALEPLPDPPKFSVSDQEMAGKRIPILMYHDVDDDTWGIENLFVRPEAFEQQLEYLKEHDYETITFEDLDHISDFKKPIMLTFDDGYLGNYEHMYPLLKKYHMKATIFVITNARLSKKYIKVKQIKEMSDSGLVSIQSHTKSHYFMGHAKADEKLIEQLADSKEMIKKMTGKEPIALAYPNGEYNTEILPEVKKYYKYALLKSGGTFHCGDDLFTMKRLRINRDTSLSGFIGTILGR